LQPDDSFQWFGKSLAIHSNINGSPLLVIGAPTFHPKVTGEENSAVGKIYFYRINQQKQATLLLSLSGCEHGGRTGYSFALSENYFAFSEPYWTPTTTADTERGRPRDELLRSGRVITVKWQDLLSLSSDLRVCDLLSSSAAPSIIEVRGTSFESRFGTTLLFDSNSLIIGAPLANDSRGEVSRVDLTTGELELLVEGTKKSSYSKPRYGSSLALTRDQDQQKQSLYVGAPYATINELEQVGMFIQV
jgi:hypothetical protein